MALSLQICRESENRPPGPGIRHPKDCENLIFDFFTQRHSMDTVTQWIHLEELFSTCQILCSLVAVDSLTTLNAGCRY